MLYNQTDLITEQLEHVVEKGSAYRWQIVRGQQWVKNGNDVSFTWSHLKNDESNTLAMCHEDNYWRTFFHRKFKQISYSFSIHMSFCKHPYMLNGGSIPLLFLSETRIFEYIYVFLHKKFELRGSVKNNWELSNISKTMKRNLLKFSMFIEQSYLHNPSKKSTPQCDVKQYDVIFSDVILRSPFVQWKSENLKRKFQLLYWEWLSWLKNSV